MECLVMTCLACSITWAAASWTTDLLSRTCANPSEAWETSTKWWRISCQSFPTRCNVIEVRTISWQDKVKAHLRVKWEAKPQWYPRTEVLTVKSKPRSISHVGTAAKSMASMSLRESRAMMMVTPECKKSPKRETSTIRATKSSTHATTEVDRLTRNRSTRTFLRNKHQISTGSSSLTAGSLALRKIVWPIGSPTRIDTVFSFPTAILAATKKSTATRTITDEEVTEITDQD